MISHTPPSPHYPLLAIGPADAGILHNPLHEMMVVVVVVVPLGIGGISGTRGQAGVIWCLLSEVSFVRPTGSWEEGIQDNEMRTKNEKRYLPP